MQQPPVGFGARELFNEFQRFHQALRPPQAETFLCTSKGLQRPPRHAASLRTRPRAMPQHAAAQCRSCSITLERMIYMGGGGTGRHTLTSPHCAWAMPMPWKCEHLSHAPTVWTLLLWGEPCCRILRPGFEFSAASKFKQERCQDPHKIRPKGYLVIS